VCLRCRSTGRKCDGYNNDLRASSPEDGLTRVIIHRIATHIPGNAEEKRGFSYFINNTAPELSGYYSSGFWESLILQASSGEPSLKHAVIAIGSLHEEFSNHKLEYEEEGTSSFAIAQYTKAIGQLRRSLANGKHSPITALMSCILFVCFDSIRGYFTNAMVHLQSGLRILRDLRKKPYYGSHLVEKIIAPLFMRLSIQAILYIDTRSPDDRRAFASELMKANVDDQPVPECFTSLEEARNIMNQSADGLFRMFYMCDGDLPFCYQPAESFVLLERYGSQITLWETAFEKFMLLKSKTMNSREIRGAALMKIHHVCIKVMAETSPSDIADLRCIKHVVNELNAYIPYKGEFETIIKLSRSLIATAEQDLKLGKSALTFSSDLGLIAPLYFVCTHCQDFKIREQAMALLKRCPRREGMWDAEKTSVMIEEFWTIEERHRVLQESSELGKSMTVPLSDVVKLHFSDGMKWEWKWREPEDVSRGSTPGGVWTDLLEDRSLFGGWFQMDGLSGTGM